MNIKKFEKILYILLYCGLILYFCIYLYNAYYTVSFPYEIDYGEGIILNQSKRLLKGENVYQNVYLYPYIITPYSPLYILLNSGLIKLFGLSFATGRVLSFIATLLIGFIVYKTVKILTNKGNIALISALLFFSSEYVFSWTPLHRTDTLALLFSITGIYFIYKYRNSSLTYFSIFFFILAIYTKQSFISAPIAAFVYLFLKNRKKGIGFFLIFILLSSLIFLIINYLTAWQFYLHTIKYIPFKDPLASIKDHLCKLLNFWFYFITLHITILSFSIIYVIYDFLSNRKLSLLSLYFISSLIMALGVIRSGGNYNYFLESIVISCILTGVFLNKILQKNKEKNIKNIFVLSLLIIQLLISIHKPYIHIRKESYKHQQKLFHYIKNIEGKIYSFDHSFVILKDKELLYQPGDVLMYLKKNNLWNDSQLINDIKNKNFSLIVLEFNINEVKPLRDIGWYHKEMLIAIKNNYYLEQNFGRYYLYKPIH